MKAELQKLEAPELEAIGESRAKQIRKTFEPMAEMVEQFEDRFNEIISQAENGIDEDLIASAKRLRLDIKNVRVETEKVRKEEKEEFLRAGQAIDAVAKILKWAVSEKEQKLKKIENHFEEMERKRLEKLQEERVKALYPYVEEAEKMELSTMEDEVWKIYFNGKKKAFEDRKEAEKQAEIDRIERERKLKLHNERKDNLIPYWEYLKKEEQQANFGELSEGDFNAILSGGKKNKQAAKEKQERLRSRIDSLNNLGNPLGFTTEEVEEMTEEGFQKALQDTNKELENQRKEAIHSERITILSPYKSFITELPEKMYDLSEDQFNKIVSIAKAKKTRHDKEQERIRKENERLQREKEERDAREQALKSGKDVEKLEALFNQVTSIELPKMRSNKGNEAMDNVVEHIGSLKESINEGIKTLKELK